MNSATEISTRMYEQFFDAFRKAAEQGLHTQQQEMMRFWLKGLTGLPGSPTSWADQVQKVQKEWTQGMADMSRRYLEALESHYQAGMKILEELYKMPESRDPEQLRRRTEEFYRKSFECIRDLGQVQVREFQAAVEKWMDVMKRSGV